MMRIRHAEHRDLDDILLLAQLSGVGMTSLPDDRETLAARIQRSQDTLQQRIDRSQQLYLFVLEDCQSNSVVGLSGIEVAVGLEEPFYSFKLAKQVHASRTLAVYKSLDTLFLSNDLTGCSELCSLFLHPDYRKDQNGKFLSKIRFLFIAAFRAQFQQRLIAEMRGVSDAHGHSPFWDALGQHFFATDFAKADFLSGTGQKNFIAELMPRFPVYIDLLPDSAKAVIAEVHPQTRPAYRVLESEGLSAQGYVDIFDAGPTLEAEISQLRAVQQSYELQVELMASTASAKQTEADVAAHSYLVANRSYHNYRAILSNHVAQPDTIRLSPKQAELLAVKQGDWVRVLPLERGAKRA